MPFLNQRKGENDRRKYFMINLHERMLPTSARVEPTTSWSPVGRAFSLQDKGLFEISEGEITRGNCTCILKIHYGMASDS